MARLELPNIDYTSRSHEFLNPNALVQAAPSSSDNAAVIAPWLASDEPPTPPPKPSRSFGFPHKASFSNFTLTKQTSHTHLPDRSRGSDSHWSIDTTSSSESRFRELSKPKSSLSVLSSMMKRGRSKPRSFTEYRDRREERHEHDEFDDADDAASFLSQQLPPFFDQTSFLPFAPSPPIILPKKDKKTRKKSLQPPIDYHANPHQQEITLDTNLDEMDGIVNLDALQSLDPTPEFGSVGTIGTLGTISSYKSSTFSHSNGSFHLRSSSNQTIDPIFTNPHPFSPEAMRDQNPPNRLDQRKVSPKTTLPEPPKTDNGNEIERPGSPSWTAPESWAVEKEGVMGSLGEPDYSSSEESVVNKLPSFPSAAAKRKSRRKTATKIPKSLPSYKNYKLRVYRQNNTYHVVHIALSVTVQELVPVLNHKLLLDPERETHRLYLKERGRERVLAQTERPADILRRRLEQAGYSTQDNLDHLGAEDLTFLLKFVYKSNLLGPADDDLNLDSFEYVDLQNRSLKTVPIALYSHTDSIISLNLSRNPMLEIPRDFIQSCTTLRELRMSYMAMKKVPQSVRHCTTLHRLDISCNRIVNLDEAYLENVPELKDLKVQNNRLEDLPWHFPRLRSLRFLNISNNKFRRVPDAVCKMPGLIDLDISFNMLTELPEEIGNLRKLERLIILGNQVSCLPDSCRQLQNLKILDCRRNNISDLSSVSLLPYLQEMLSDHNTIHALDLSLGESLTFLDASWNDITQLTLVPGPMGCGLTSLDISHAKLSSLADVSLGQLSSLTTLRLDCNSFKSIPDSLGKLSRLTYLSCSDNELTALPSSLGQLQKLERLDAHNNSLTELPATIWNCASLTEINVTSNLLVTWHDPPAMSSLPSANSYISIAETAYPDRKSSTTSLTVSHNHRYAPPLAHSLERLYIGENRLIDDVLHPLTHLKQLRILNLSFNDIQEIPPHFFRSLNKLVELYLSGNNLSALPTEDLHRLMKLTVLFLNGNKLQTLPRELGKIKSLEVLDVGSNILKYNINNWEFDWNWNFNKNLKYLNLSGNKRLEIKPDAHPKGGKDQHNAKMLADFSGLHQLRVLGLMDVTTTFLPNIPDEHEDRRVRTSVSEVNRMAYGIADTLGKSDTLHMFDLVQPEFRDRKDEAIFAMFGRAQPFGSSNRLSKYLHDNFVSIFSQKLAALDPGVDEDIPIAMRRTFLELNKLMYNFLYNSVDRKMSQVSGSTNGVVLQDVSTRCGASGVVLYLVDKKLYAANAGDALAVVSRQGSAVPLSRKHDPFNRDETSRIRTAEGWVSPKGFVNDEIDVSRSFGFYPALPVVNSCPYVQTYDLTALDEFVIIGNRELWNYVSFQTAVDIARSERHDPMIAAQKLRDFAISYGADGSTMIMVICVADLFSDGTENLSSLRRRRRGDEIIDRNISRLDDEVRAPVGHIALVFTDIRNSTHLWEVNPGMATAMRLHNSLLRRQLRLCGGYEVKTEGDAFMCSFPTTLSALWWSLTVQEQLQKEAWPLEILECEDGKQVFDEAGNLIQRGLSVRMGIHCGMPACERDPVTHRMDYFGSMVNRSARINSRAAGGQIMCSADVIREINARIYETEPETDYSYLQPIQAIEAIRLMRPIVVPVGEVKLKGLEVPEVLSAVYPASLIGRKDLEDSGEDPSGSTSRIQFSVEQIRALGMLTIRLESLASSRIFRPVQERRCSLPGQPPDDTEQDSRYMYGDPNVLLPPLHDKASESELMLLLDSFSVRIENALASISMKYTNKLDGTTELLAVFQRQGGCDQRTLQQILSLLQGG